MYKRYRYRGGKPKAKAKAKSKKSMKKDFKNKKAGLDKKADALQNKMEKKAGQMGKEALDMAKQGKKKLSAGLDKIQGKLTGKNQKRMAMARDKLKGAMAMMLPVIKRVGKTARPWIKAYMNMIKKMMTMYAAAVGSIASKAMGMSKGMMGKMPGMKGMMSGLGNVGAMGKTFLPGPMGKMMGKMSDMAEGYGEYTAPAAAPAAAIAAATAAAPAAAPAAPAAAPAKKGPEVYGDPNCPPGDSNCVSKHKRHWENVCGAEWEFGPGNKTKPLIYGTFSKCKKGKTIEQLIEIRVKQETTNEMTRDKMYDKKGKLKGPIKKHYNKILGFIKKRFKGNVKEMKDCTKPKKCSLVENYLYENSKVPWEGKKKNPPLTGPEYVDRAKLYLDPKGKIWKQGPFEENEISNMKVAIKKKEMEGKVGKKGGRKTRKFRRRSHRRTRKTYY
jgi:hypothetical protein